LPEIVGALLPGGGGGGGGEVAAAAVAVSLPPSPQAASKIAAAKIGRTILNSRVDIVKAMSIIWQTLLCAVKFAARKKTSLCILQPRCPWITRIGGFASSPLDEFANKSDEILPSALSWRNLSQDADLVTPVT
jgi:hypothetical protein